MTKIETMIKGSVRYGFAAAILASFLTACSDSPALEQDVDHAQLNLDVVETGWQGETIVLSRSGETLEGLRAIYPARSWNLASIPEADIDLLNASKNATPPNTPLWTYDEGTKTYTSASAINSTLKGGAEGTTELSFAADLNFSAASENIHLVSDGSDNCIRFTGVLTVNNLKAGQTVTVQLKSPDGERIMNASNISGSPVINATTGKASQTRTVANNGSVSFTAPADINIYSISVSKAEDEGFGIYCQELSISNMQVTWDNTNGKWKIGDDYNTYWRRNQSEILDIYAYAPYKSAGYSVTNGKLTYQAQHHDYPGYGAYLSGNNVDLLYASKKDYARNSSESAILEFNHALAKMTFGTITNNTGGPLNINGYTIRGTLYNAATLDLTNGEWSGHVTNAVGSVAFPPPFAPSSASPLADKETILPPMPNRELTFIPGPDPGIPGSGPGGTLPLTIEVNSSTTNETFSFDVTLEQGKNKTYNITIGKNHEVVIVEE